MSKAITTSTTAYHGPEVIFSAIRHHHAFLKKVKHISGKPATFSLEPLNPLGIHSVKYSGFARERSADIKQNPGKGYTLLLKSQVPRKKLKKNKTKKAKKEKPQQSQQASDAPKKTIAKKKKTPKRKIHPPFKNIEMKLKGLNIPKTNQIIKSTLRRFGAGDLQRATVRKYNAYVIADKVSEVKKKRAAFKTKKDVSTAIKVSKKQKKGKK
eukprot:TRINITY_DN134_c0_g1_i2.p1 TRINITY_DN134_c0_g1~~TRINITY_DN134_c0_g1_i2.p1  ORF type:complete len:232 (-),score=59.64 TRINITY_DN134_c0_g1_i2:77-709(-)